MTTTTSASSASAPSATDSARRNGPDGSTPERTITLAELLPMMQAAAERMSPKNPTRRILWLAGQVIVQLAQEVAVLREAEAARESRIVLPGN